MHEEDSLEEVEGGDYEKVVLAVWVISAFGPFTSIDILRSRNPTASFPKKPL